MEEVEAAPDESEAMRQYPSNVKKPEQVKGIKPTPLNHKLHNKFAEDPTLYRHFVDPIYLGIYDGLNKQFWDGYRQPPHKKVLCFIE